MDLLTKKAICWKQTITLVTSIILDSVLYGDTHLKVEWSPICSIFYTRQLSIQDCLHCNLVLNALEEWFYDQLLQYKTD